MPASACKSLKFQKLRYGSRGSPHSWQITCLSTTGFGFPDWVTHTVERPAQTAMKTRHFWIEMISLCVAIACGLAFLIALGVAAVAAADPEPGQAAGSAQQTYEGMITDAHCGAKHLASMSKTAADCARSCVHAGSQFALVDGDKTYILSGAMERLKRAAGLRLKPVRILTAH